MNNYKIRVESEAESREALNCFVFLGNKESTAHGENRFGMVYASEGFCSTDRMGFWDDYDEEKEITLPELRDLVVLKRNSIEDATHEGTISGKYYVSSSNNVYRFDLCWVSANYNENGIKNCLKPIEKKEMKEFLVKTDSGNYLYAKNVSDILQSRVIEIPEDAIKATLCNDFLIFWKDDFLSLSKKNGDTDFTFDEKEDYGFVEYMDINDDAVIVWQRHTQPEELPLIDGEPTLNDQYAEIEKIRQAAKETEYLMQGKNGDKLMESLAQFHNTDRGVDFDNFELLEDNVNHPSHYTNGKVECIDALESATVGKRGIEAVCVANVIKYLWRYEDKNGIEDIKKAKWYLEKLINTLE